MSSNISESVIKRLPRYYRFLGELKAAGMTRISSRELSEKMGLTASQIRQDLNCFGGFGQQGYGDVYKRQVLHLAEIVFHHALSAHCSHKAHLQRLSLIHIFSPFRPHSAR